MKDLQSKIALVTGASRGIGAAIVRELASRGAQVIFTYGKSVTEANALSKATGAEAVQADSADIQAVRQVVTDVVKRHGHLDILVNNAGVFIAPQNDTEYDHQNNINIKAVWAAVKAAAPLLADGGRIVSTGSVLGELVKFGGVGEYAATKAAVAMMTRSWARELGARGITVNCVQPGPIDTDMNPANSDMAPMLKPMTALNRYGKPEEVAALVGFLCSPAEPATSPAHKSMWMAV
jgi:3-oxoacyl-[acyl-carrier protein] reductase